MMARYSVEKLIHFQCEADRCLKWWAIGDYLPKAHKKITCPWCGSKQRLIPISKGF